MTLPKQIEDYPSDTVGWLCEATDTEDYNVEMQFNDINDAIDWLYEHMEKGYLVNATAITLQDCIEEEADRECSDPDRPWRN